MLNYIWLALIALAVLLGGLQGKIDLVGAEAVSRAKMAVVEIGFGLIGVMTLWLGLMRLADKAGLVSRLGLALRPIMVWLFPEVPANHPAMGAIVMNVAANILGLNNAATPLGLRAMAELEKLNRHPGVATNAMCMLLAINTSSITLIPVTVIGLLVFYKSSNPTVIIGTSLAATAVSHAAAIIACKLLERSPWFRLPPVVENVLPAPVAPALAPKPEAAKSEGQTVQDEASRADAELPWVPGARWILAVAAGAFLGMALGIAFPVLARTLAIDFDAAFPWFNPLFGLTSADRLPVIPPQTQIVPLRLVEAVSVLAIPWLILFFPLYATLRRIPVYDEFVEGGKEGFQVIIRILPYIVAMLVAVGMFSAAGGLDIIKSVLSPVTSFFHFPPELVPIALIRPFSGAASLALLADLIKTHGPDSFLALTACTFYGCSETTFYVIAVYFGSVGIRRTRHAIPAGLIADFIGPIASVIICRAVFSA